MVRLEFMVTSQQRKLEDSQVNEGLGVNLNWTLGYALLEVFPIHCTVLFFQGYGAERMQKRGEIYPSGVGIGAERK